MHDSSLHKSLNRVLTSLMERPIFINSIDAVGGGSINRAYKVREDTSYYFIKVNNADHAFAMFNSEQDGLQTLRDHSDFRIPKVYGTASYHDEEFLVMDFIQSAPRTNSYWDVLGEKLASLHRTSNSNFGYTQNNFIGSLHQKNNSHTTWSDFFVVERVEPLIKLAVQQNLMETALTNRFNNALPNMLDLIPIEPPSLIHGDLWSGNLMTDERGEPTIIDPAIYYGHREMDLAFTHLFGGFSAEFYEAYQHYYPLEHGFGDRIDIHNLYPLLVHLNLFGRSYLYQIEQIVHRFT
jgi:protein-ribulosamine 3-kinase